MNELTVLDYQGAKVISSREVAEMTGKEHKELMRSIRKYSGILTSANLRSLDYFIPSEYTDAKKEVRPCYLLTKIGCDMIGNKMTGTQGVLFTAAYVKQFEEMQQALNTPKVLTEKEQLKAAMKLSLETSEEMEVIKGKVVELQHMVENQITLNSGEQRRLQLAVAERVYKLEKIINLFKVSYFVIYTEQLKLNTGLDLTGMLNNVIFKNQLNWLILSFLQN